MHLVEVIKFVNISEKTRRYTRMDDGVYVGRSGKYSTVLKGTFLKVVVNGAKSTYLSGGFSASRIRLSM